MMSAGGLLSVLLGLSACHQVKFSLYLAIFLLITVVVIVAFFRAKWVFSVVICLLFVTIGIARYYIVTANGPERCKSLAGKTVTVTATIIDNPESYYGKYYYSVKTESVSNPVAGQELKLVFGTKEVYNAFDRIEAILIIYEPDERNKSFDYAEGIYCEAECISSKYIGHSKLGFSELAIKTRDAVRQEINNRISPKVSGIFIGLITDGTSFMDKESYNSFKSCGLTHAVTVSGMHMVVVASAIMKFLEGLKLSNRWKIAVLTPILTVYIAISGFSPAAVRSGIMIAAVFLSDTLYRRGDQLNILGATATIMLIISPCLIYDLSFLLSFSSVAGLIASTPFISALSFKIKGNGILAKGIKYVMTSVTTSIVANIATFPLILLKYGWISTMSVIANLFICFVFDFLLVLGMIIIPLSFVFGESVIMSFAFKLAEMLLFYTKGIASLLAGMPYSTASLDLVKYGIITITAFLMFSGYMLTLDIPRAKLKRVMLTATSCLAVFYIAERILYL